MASLEGQALGDKKKSPKRINKATPAGSTKTHTRALAHDELPSQQFHVSPLRTVKVRGKPDPP